jgi:hypothetical protein
MKFPLHPQFVYVHVGVRHEALVFGGDYCITDSDGVGEESSGCL